MTSLFFNIHTGQWWCVGRDAKVPFEPFSFEPFPYDPTMHRIEIASCIDLKKSYFLVQYYKEPFAIFDSGWVLTSESHGDRFIAGFGFGNIPAEINGRDTRRCYLSSLDAPRTLQVGETLVAHPPGPYEEAMESIYYEIWTRIDNERRAVEWYDTDGNKVLNEDR